VTSILMFKADWHDGIEQGRVYDIQAECDTSGPEVEHVEIRAYWTGEVDTWGKATFQPVDGRPAYYLFPREITSVEPVSECSPISDDYLRHQSGGKVSAQDVLKDKTPGE